MRKAEEGEHSGADCEPAASVVASRQYLLNAHSAAHPVHDLPPGLAPFAHPVK